MKAPAVLLAAILLAAGSSAQKVGDTWTGIVTNVNQSTFEITLTYTKGHKTQTFVGKPEKDYLIAPKNCPVRALRPSDIHVGRKLTVYYMSERKTVHGKEITVNTIVLIPSVRNNKSFTIR